MLDEIICIVGPTASGKTGLGIELAKRINAEISKTIPRLKNILFLFTFSSPLLSLLTSLERTLHFLFY